MSKQQCIIRKQDEGPLLSKEIEQHAPTVRVRICLSAWALWVVNSQYRQEEGVGSGQDERVF